MRTTAFIQALLASFVLSACASGPALDAPRRDAATGLWRAPTVYTIRSSLVAPVVDTTAQREALRRLPHGADHLNGATFHR